MCITFGGSFFVFLSSCFFFFYGKYVFIEQLCKQHTPDMIGMRIKAPSCLFLGRLKRKHHKGSFRRWDGEEELDVGDALFCGIASSDRGN
jgi:hypothetical protein